MHRTWEFLRAGPPPKIACSSTAEKRFKTPVGITSRRPREKKNTCTCVCVYTYINIDTYNVLSPLQRKDSRHPLASPSAGLARQEYLQAVCCSVLNVCCSVLQCVAVWFREEIQYICRYGVAAISRLVTIIGFFFKRALQKRLSSAEETYNFKEPNNQSHPTSPSAGLAKRKSISGSVLQRIAVCCSVL